MAEVLSKHMASEKGLGFVEVRSAGTHTRSGLPASDGALRAVGRHGLSLEEHKSVALSEELAEWADLIFAMGMGHLHRIEMLGGGEKMTLLSAFAKNDGFQMGSGEGEELGVPDPFGGDDGVYEETFRTLERYVELTIDRLSGGVGG